MTKHERIDHHPGRGRGVWATVPFLALALGACGHTMPQGDAPPGDGQRAGNTPALAATVPLPLAQPVAIPTVSNVADLVEAVSPSVVNITVVAKLTSSADGQSPFDFFFKHPPIGPDGGEFVPERTGMGTGFIVDDGFVVTNAHVVEGATEVSVRLMDDRVFPAEVVGRDSRVDLAILKLRDASGLPSVSLGSADSLRVGESVLAVGNPYGLGHTVTMGIVSAKARSIGAGPYDDFIQTDASINPGNSGGPLFDLRGQVVGINTAIRAGANGIGFAIPVDTLKDVMPQLKQTGHVERGKLGLAFQPMTDDLARALGLDRPHGAVVNEVMTGSAAARAGIHEGDVIVAVEGVPVRRSEDLPRNVARHAPGSVIHLGLLRDGKPLAVAATLDRLEPEPGEAGYRPPQPSEPARTDTLLGLDLSDEADGVRVVRVRDGARELLPGDLIVEANGQHVASAAQLRALVGKQATGDAVLLKVKRGEHSRYVGLPLRH